MIVDFPLAKGFLRNYRIIMSYQNMRIYEIEASIAFTGFVIDIHITYLIYEK